MNEAYAAALRYYVPTNVPANWNAEKDKREYDDTVDKPEDYYEDVKCRLEDAYYSLNWTVERGIQYFTKKIKHSVPIPVEAFTLGEKLQLLEELVGTSSDEVAYLTRFGDLIAYGHFVDAKRGRLLSAYYGLGKPCWVSPMLELADCLVTAEMRLEEALVCEHADYEESSECQFSPPVEVPADAERDVSSWEQEDDPISE